MLSAWDNELLCRVGPGTAMGALMREFWVPALISPELPAPDCPPVRLRLLGENLIGVRLTSGQPALFADACPHRGASMFFGRNEDEGLRCVYHGWKFAADGRCVEMPSEPPESNFGAKVRLTAYPCRERNGIVWAYMGPRETPPPLPDLEVNMLEGMSKPNKILRNCNWLQGMEGDLDPAHFGFLHFGHVEASETAPGSIDYLSVKYRTPRHEVVDTEYGTSGCAFRPTDRPGLAYYAIHNFLFPFYAQPWVGVLGEQVFVRAWVPVDDEHVMIWGTGETNLPSADEGGWKGKANAPTKVNLRTSKRLQFRVDYLPHTSDWLGRWRKVPQASNDYLLDNEAKRSRASYSGLPTTLTEDTMATESMGAIADRRREHLGTLDSMIIRVRRRLIDAAKALRDRGVLPPGVDHPEVYRQRGGGVLLPAETTDWFAATAELRKAFVEHRAHGPVPLEPVPISLEVPFAQDAPLRSA